MKERSTTVVIDTSKIPDQETARHTVREAVRPWLDELEKDGLEYQDLTFYMESGLDPEKPHIMSITAVVSTYSKEQ